MPTVSKKEFRTKRKGEDVFGVSPQLLRRLWGINVQGNKTNGNQQSVAEFNDGTKEKVGVKRREKD